MHRNLRSYGLNLSGFTQNREVGKTKRYTVSIIVFLYASSALVDVMLGFSMFDPARSYLFRLAAVTLILTLYLHLMGREKRLRPLPFVLASLTLSVFTIIAYRQIDLATLANTILKALAAILTLKPESIELEIFVEKGERFEG